MARVARSQESAVSIALSLIAKGQQGRAQRMLESRGLGNLADPAIISQLQAKHPVRRREFSARLSDPPAATGALEVHLEAKYLGLSKLAGTGPSGYRNEYLTALAGWFEDSRARDALGLHERFANEYVNGRLPPWFSYLWSTVRLVAPVKKAPEVPNQTPDVRPVGIGEPRRVACVSQVMEDWKGTFAGKLWPHQVAIGVPSGVHVLGIGLRMALEAHPEWVLLKLDLINAFNEMSRAAVLDSIAEGFDGDFADLAPLFQTSLAFKSMIVLGDASRSPAPFDSEEGMQQGSGEGPAGFCLGMHPDLVDADQQLAPHGGCAKADMDDTYLFGPLEQVLSTAVRFGNRLRERTGIQLNVGKSALHSRNPARDFARLSSDPEYASLFKIGCLDGVDPSLDAYGRGFGIIACGVPIGDEPFLQHFVDSKVDAALEQIQTTSQLLRGVHHQSAWVQTLACLRPKLDFLAQTCHGPHVSAALQRFDDAVLAAAGASACLPLHQFAGRHARRLALPARLFGCGLRRVSTVAPAAFAGTLCRIAPMLIHRQLEERQSVGFLDAQLSHVFQAGSFDSEWEPHRFDGLLASRCSTGLALASCWESMMAAHVEAHGGALPESGPLSVQAGAAGTEDSKVLSKPQHAFTEAMELAVYDQLDLEYKGLPPSSPERQAWLNLDRFSTQWVTALPSPTLGWVLGNDVFPEIVAAYLALPSPACAPLVGQRVGRYSDVLDPLGVKLATLSLPGDGWRVRHDELKHLIDRDIQSHGLPCSCEVFGLFAPLLPQASRLEWMAAPARKRQGMVPDYLATLPEGFEALLELKVIGAGPSHYARDEVRRGYAVEARAASVPQESRNKALRLDHQHCGSPEGTPGPVTQKLASYGRIRGLVFGAFGEASPDVHELAEVLATSSASRQWVRMGSRDPLEAAATLKRTLYRSWGLMAVRAQARLKLAGLSHVGTGASAARARRSGATAAHARRREAYQLHFAAARRGRW